MYSKEFRNAIALYHFNQIFYDLHHLYLFVPYPIFPMPIFVCHGLQCRWNAPTRLLMTFTGFVASFGSFSLYIVIFMRLRNIVPLESKFRLTVKQSSLFLGFTGVLMISNTIGFAIFAGDDPRKEEILNVERSELLWLQEKPGALVWGDMFDTPAFNNELYYLAVCLFYGVTVWPGILAYSAIALRREKKKLLEMTSLKKSNDQGNRMLQIQMWGANFTFLIPLALLIISVKIGIPTTNPYIQSVVRVVFIFLFVNNSMVAILLHLVMNRVYQNIIIYQVKRIFKLHKQVNPNQISFTASSYPIRFH